jgi:hypothetical protein
VKLQPNFAQEESVPLYSGNQNWRQLASMRSAKLVDLIGIEPMTSSMPWKDNVGVLLTEKDL